MLTRPLNPYVPTYPRSAVSGSRPLTATYDGIADTNIASTSSFIYDVPGTGLKSTQQLNVDWSQFQNHTFFMSAEAKVNLAFDAVINEFPFDGTRKESEVFAEKLSGFEKWVLDSFPSYRGELLFSGTYIKVDNKVGSLYPALSKQNTGAPILNPVGSYTVEMQLYVPPVSNDVQTICQMLADPDVGSPGSTQGWSFFMTQSLSTDTVDATFAVVSGSSFMTVPVTLNKGVFNHVAVEINRTAGLPWLESFMTSIPFASSRAQIELGELAVNDASLLIGSGSALLLGSSLVMPVQTLSGTIDEFRVFSSPRTSNQLAAYAGKALYSTPDLLLYYRFNEPPPPIASSPNDNVNSIVLDSSGNSLHASISGFFEIGTSSSIGIGRLPGSGADPDACVFDYTVIGTNVVGSTTYYTSSIRYTRGPELRGDAAQDPLNPVVYERPDSLHVLFPAYPPTLAFNQRLLTSASAYDQENPNLITKLVPQHYFLEGGFQDGFVDPPEGNVGQPYGGNGIPGQGQMGNVQILVSLLYIWARFFDDLKLYVDSFSTLRTVDYNANETIPDVFLLDMVDRMGFHLPPLFNDSSIDQYVRGENVDLQNYTTNVNTLQQVQNQLLRRVLTTLPHVLKSKGTQYSIQAFLRSIGIDPGNNIRIREYGGPTTRQLSYTRESKFEPGTMVQFSPTSSFVTSPPLLATRIEPGYPQPAGTFIIDAAGRNVGTTDYNDSLLTSGSWTWEGIVKWTPTSIPAMTSATQSIARLCTDSIQVKSTSHTTFAISASLTSQTVLAANPLRLGVTLYNPTSSSVAYVSLGPIASTSSFLVAMQPESYYSLDALSIEPLSVIFDASSGSLMVTEQDVGLYSSNPNFVVNLLAISSSLQPRLVMYARPGAGQNSPLLRLELDTPMPGYTNLDNLPPGMFNFDHWNVSFGCRRNDDCLHSAVSSSYFLRMAYQNAGKVEFFETTSSFFQEAPYGEGNVLQSLDMTTNATGPYLAFGPTQFVVSGSGYPFVGLNDTSRANDDARTTDFNGRLSNVRFWSKALSEVEWREHVRCYTSTGVSNPLMNWNYTTTPSGSWQRLRLNSLIAQDIRQAISTGSSTSLGGAPDSPVGPTGSIVFPDFSENGFHLTGSLFPVGQDIVVGETFELSHLSPYFDEATCDEKIRVRSYKDLALVEQTPWAHLAPQYEIDPSEAPTDDVRLSVEFSLIDALNRDIVTMFATFDAIDNALGAPELTFSPDYPDLMRLSDVYFNRIKARLNFQAFYEFFLWFDRSIGTFIKQLIPRKTSFNDVNFMIESHMLERAKLEYQTYNSYLGDSNRTNLNTSLFLQQIAGTISKY